MQASRLSHIVQSIDEALDNLFLTRTTRTLNIYPRLFRNGYASAASHVLYAALLNHLRRILAPSLGQFLHHCALTDMKFAKSSPHWYLVSVLDGAGLWAAVEWACMMGALRVVWLCARGGSVVVELVFVLGWWEYAFVRTCWTLSQVYAYGILMFGKDPEGRSFLMEKVWGERWHALPLQVGLVMHWGLCVRGLLSTANSRAWLPCLMVLAVTAYLVRYSNKYFVLLEMSDMLVTWSWMALGIGMVFQEMTRGWVRNKQYEASKTIPNRR